MPILVEDRDDDRAGLRFVVELAQMHQRGGKPRHADGKSGGGHRLAAKARDKPVISSAAADRAEAYGKPSSSFGRERQLNLENGAGVIFEAAHDGRIDCDAVDRIAPSIRQQYDLFEFIKASSIDFVVRKYSPQLATRSSLYFPLADDHRPQCVRWPCYDCLASHELRLSRLRVPRLLERTTSAN